MAAMSAIKSSTGIVLPEVRTVVLRRHSENKEKNVHRTSVIYPSEMARSDWCPKATYYRMSGLPDKSSSPSFTLENVFAEGNAIHSKWQRWLADTGKLWGDWRCNRCTEYVKNSVKPGDRDYGPCVGIGFVMLGEPLKSGMDTETKSFPHDWEYKEVTLKSASLPISGHADGGLIGHNALIELKSVGLGTLRFEAPKIFAANEHEVGGKKIADIEGMWKDLHRPLLSHIKQGNIYLWMAREMGLPFDRIQFVYEFKANQQVKEFSVWESSDILDPMLDTAAKINYAVRAGVPPACPKGGCANCKAYEK